MLSNKLVNEAAVRMDELLHWLEIRITSSLRPRADEIKNLLLDHTYRSQLCEFLKNEDVHTLYIYFKLAKASLAATLSPPSALQNKCICFVKLGAAIKLTLENIANHVMTVDCAKFPLKYFDTVLHKVYLPLLCNDNTTGGIYSADKIIDILHRFTGNLEVIAGHAEGFIILPIPSLELLKDTPLFNKSGAAIHIMETTVIGWIRQIKVVLKHDPLAEIKARGVTAGIYHEKEMWETHIHNLESISMQLNSAEAKEIVYHLEQAKSMYGNSIAAVTQEVQTAHHQARENLTFLKTLSQYYDQLKSAKTTTEKLKYFFPMLHCLFLVWTHSRYYHQPKVFVNLLRLMSKEMVEIAGGLLGRNILASAKAYSLLKEALKMCATFRGNYLDVKIKADELNAKKMEEYACLNKSNKSTETIWNITMYEVPAPWVYGRDQFVNDKKQKDKEQTIWIGSPWPLYNAPCFQNMNMFMERCNDVLDLVETMKHFEVLKAVATIGGAGTSSLDAMVQEIWSSYCLAKDSFIDQITDIFTVDKNSPFQKAFFDLRTTIKSLEHQLGNILRSSFDQCPTIASHLRLLEVFEGVSRRDIVMDHLKDEDLHLLNMFIEEISQVKDMFQEMADNPPLHVNMTPTVSKLLWIKGLRARISDPMAKLRTLSPLTLEGDMGWELRHLYTDLSEELERFEKSLMTFWLSAVNRELSDSLKLPLLKASGSEHREYLHTAEINLNPDLLVYLREAEYFLKPPFTVKLPESIGSLINQMDANRFKMLSTRLETVVSKYNEVIKTISYHQKALFEKKLLKISEILRDGMSVFTWSMDESADYTELATSYICTDLYNNFSIVTNNYKLISELTAAWCTASLDIFTCRESSRSYSITELMIKQKKIEHDLESLLIPDGQRIHNLVQQSFVACCISEASPAWQDFIMHIDTVVLQGLKKVTISSLAALLNTLLDYDHDAILSIEVELINGDVAFNPPLDQSTSATSVMENIEEWLKMFLLRGSHIRGLSSIVKGGYQDYLSEDEEALQLIGHILQQVENGVVECQALLELFGNYSYLWKKDVNAEFQHFLQGKERVNISPGKEVAGDKLASAMKNNNNVSVKSHNILLTVAERAFILPKETALPVTHGPLLEDFDSEISVYKTARDSIQRLPDHQQCRWIQVDFRPIKQVLSAYALKWMWTFTKYLIDQTSATLKSLDSFLRRTEPQIESITGEERDTGSFMKMMRLFNEVSSKQAEMEVQFTMLQRTVTLLGKHEMALPTDSEVLYKTMPARWNSMKTKVSLAKQRLGPRIQQEADIVTRDLERFQRKLDVLGTDIETSYVYKYECTSQEAFGIIQKLSTQVQVLQNKAKDLKELQELLETTVVDFSILNNCEDLLQNLNLVWKHVDSILKEQDIWKKELWQDMDTEELYKRTRKQLILLQSLPGEVQEWDVYKQALEEVSIMHLTLPLIEDLSNPAMRTRHWKQLVRQTGGMLRVTAETLNAMTLGDLLAMDLQKHTGDVRTTVQRAMRDATIESSLKNCEEVWLSRIFDLGPHSRVISARAENEELASSISGSHYTKGDMGRNLTTGKGSRRLSKQSDRGLHKKSGRGSTMSLFQSLKHIEEFGKVLLLRNTASVFEELEHHQLVLTSIQPYAEAGSFLDEVSKWQKKLQVIETTVLLWLSAQDKWTQLEEVFSTLAFRVAMPREAILFADVHHHFCRLMKSVEENPNILQNCTRRGLQSLLDMLNYKLERCQRAARRHLEQKRQTFPRLFFLSSEDTLNIVCYGYDLDVLSGYIMKIFQHVRSLIYQSSSEQDCHQILGVRSFLGEELYLTKPLECSGPVEIWLPQLVCSVKASLQHHLWAAMEHTNVVITRRREIHSAGARRVVINKTASKEEAATDKRKISASSKEESSSTESGCGESQVSKHWVLNTLSDVAYLSTQIKFCQEYKGNRDYRNETMQGCLKDLTEGIEYAAKILNEIPQKDIQLHSERTSKAERKGNGQGEGEYLGKEQDMNLLAPKPILSAGDVVKLTNHILLLLYQRDVASQILSGTAPIWKQSQPLCYEYDDITKDIVVKIGDSEIHYGYEYQGSAEHILITPLTERVFLSVMGAVSAGIDALCIGPQASGKTSTVRELSLALGKPLFCFHCTKTSDHSILQDICKGLAATGAWVCINGLEQLPQPSLSLLAQLLTQIQSARHLGKETVTLQWEEVPLNTAGACIAIIKRSPTGTMYENNYSHSCKLPDSLLNCFRIVGVSEFPVNFFLEAQLLLKGFSHVAYLAQKLSAMLNLFAKLYKADLMGSGSSENGKCCGSSIPELNNLLDEAGNILKSLHKCHIDIQGQESASTDEDWQQSLEDRAVVIAIQNCWLTQLSKDRAHVVRSFLAAEWPNALNSLNTVVNNLDGLIPAVNSEKYGPGQQVPSSECTEESNVPSAIIKAAEKCHIFPSNTFVSKVSHLVQLAPKYQTVVITGPAGCGKTTCIKTFLETLRGEGKKVKTDTVYTKALQSGHFLGFMNKSARWIDGLLPQLLRTYCQPCTLVDNNQVNVLHVDGEVNGHEMELIQKVFCGAEFFTSENNERIRISDSLLLFWELETLANVSPSVLCCMGILAITSDDMDWKLPLKIWMKTHAEERQPLLLQLTETFLEPCLQFLRDNQILPQPGDERNRTQRDLFLCEASVVHTFCRISEALTQHVPEMLTEDIKKYFIFSCIWSFGGWLDSDERTVFSNWWRQIFRNHTTFPIEGEVWDYHIDTDTRHFVRWLDTLSSYSGSHGQSMASEAFVHTLHSEQFLYLASLLTTSGYPVLLAGDVGCGKSVLSQELLNCLCLGDVAEMSELRIPINSSTDPQRLWGCLKDRLEWRHGTLHTPAGNKKLLCLLDDLNLAKVNEYDNQAACEFVRQLLDQERIFDPNSMNWKTIKGIIYLATWNTTTAESSPVQRQRLLRHFCTFHCKYPSQSEQLGIFSNILNAHFVPGVTEHKVGSKCTVSAEHIQELIIAITKVSIELQERLRTVFLGTSQRCHYIFTLRDLAKIFRNICHSLDGGTTTDKLLRLWRHECDWVYGHRMSSSVDYSRFVQELTIAAQKVFINEEEVQIILSPQQPSFSNIVEDDGGLITTVARQQDMNFFRKSEKTSNTTHILDGYQQTFDLVHVKQLLTEALREYNKVNPRMSITFYQCAIRLLGRLVRNLWSSQGSAHTLLCGEGCPRSSTALARLAAHLSGFSVVQLGSHTKTEDEEQRNRNFKSQLVDCYVKAGLKGHRTLLLLTEEEIDPTSLVYITEFVVFGSVSHLFTAEQQATIANAMRSEVTNAGLTYSKESAWNLFLQSVQQNIRWLLIRSDLGSTFYKWCLQFSSLVNALNVYYIPQWSQENLIEHASYHIQDLDMLTKQEIENVCHLLSSMHLSIIKHVKSTEGKYGNITNATFENFVQCFRALIKDQYAIIIDEHELAKEALGCIAKKLKSHEKLTDDLTHENIVLEQHKEGTLKILQTIAQDKAVVEQKIHAVHQQLQKIKKFRSLLPEYQVALEKAEYKCSALIENIKELVQNMNITALGELRAMQKPDVDIEELMASIIIILKSPNTDLTWAKGAKRQMANIDRFLNELTTFHSAQLPQSTLELLETNVRKVQFTPENMERKAAGNVASGSLMRWLQGAVQYYRILTSKVKPLQRKVSGMAIALEEAEQKMTTLQQRKNALHLRLADLGRGFEEATVHKSKQQQTTIEIAQKLDQAARIAQLLEEQKKKYVAIVNALQDRLSGIPGSTAMAAGLVSYLGSYEHHFRQLMLTVEWPMAVKERGFSLMIDSTDPDKGHVIEFLVIFTCDSPMEKQKNTHDAEQKEDAGKDNINGENDSWYPDQGEITSKGLSLHSQFSPIITEELYMDFIKALLMRIVKQDEIQKWSAKDWTPQQMENAAILSFSWQRPVLLVDPCFEGEAWVQDTLGTSLGNPFSSINLQARQDSSILAPIEKTILSGGPLILNNYCNKWDDLLMPLIDHCCAAHDKSNQQDSSSIISFNRHRLLCADHFKLYLAAYELEPRLNTEISSGTTIINYNFSEGSLLELLIRRAFAKVQPDLYNQLVEMDNIILNHQRSLKQLEKKSRECFISPELMHADVSIITISEEKKKISEELQKAKSQLNDLLQVREALYPLAQRGAQYYSILKSLRSLADEYYFTLDFFLKLFDSAIGIKSYTKEDFIQMESETFHDDSLPAPPHLGDDEIDGQINQRMTEDQDVKKTGDDVPAHKGQPPLNRSAEPHNFSLSSNQMRKIMDQLTQAVYQTIIQSLLPEHSTQACALLFFCTQHMENGITEDELAFFAKGSCLFNTIKSETFFSNISPPPWLPYDRWEELMTLSATSVPLRQLCIQIAEHSSEWEKWYSSDYPDVENSDGSGNEETAEKGVVQLPACGDMGSQLDDFHRLLVIRAARPDRFPNALCRCVERLSNDLEFHDLLLGIDNIAVLEQNIFGVLVIESSVSTNATSYGDAILNHKAELTICRAAKEKNIPLFIVSMKNGNEEEVKVALNDTMNQNGWLIIENLHLASKVMLKNLSKSLRYAAKMRVSQKEERQFCVWLTSEHRTSIPEDFLARLKKVSWHFLMLNQISRKTLSDVIYIDSLPRLLYSALDQMKESTCVKVKMNPTTVQRLCFGICVLHGVLQTQWIFPRTGLNNLIYLSPVQLTQALDAVLSIYDKMKTCDNDFTRAVVEGVNSIYACLTLTLEDTAYIQALVHEIISCSLQQQEFLVINHLSIPIPPADVDPAQYSSWLIDHIPAIDSYKESLLPRTTERAADDLYALKFMQDLLAMYDAMKSSLPLIIPEDHTPVKQLADLRTSSDKVLGQLPPLIQIDVLHTSFKEVSSINHGTAEDHKISKHILFQECNWMNTNLKHIKNNVSMLSNCLLGGVTAIPEDLRSTAEALQKAEVPKSWLPSHSCQTSPKIIPWLEGLHRKHKQQKQWMKKGLMPFAKSEKEALTSISLGGLVNPEALLLALKVEFAVHHGYLLHEVVLQCHIAEYPDYKPDSEVYPLYLEGLVLQGAAWDFKNNHLKESRDTIHPLSCVTITPIHFGNMKPIEDGTEVYECPVYMDHTMQHCVMRLPLLGTKPVRQWHIRRVAIILNPDLDATTSGRAAPTIKHIQRNIPSINSLTKVDKSSHSRIFNRARKDKDCLFVQAQAQETSRTDAQGFSTESVLIHSLLVDESNQSAGVQQNLKTDVVTKEKITVSGKNSLSNQDDKFIRGDVNDENQMVSVPDEKEDGNELKMGLAEGTGFVAFQSDGAADTENEPLVKEHLMVHTRNSDFEHPDNEHDHGSNNGNFDESENKEYKGEFDKKWRETFNESLQGNNDYEAGENKAGYNYEQDNVEYNEQAFDYSNNSTYVNVSDDNPVGTKGHNVNSQKAEGNL